MLRSLCKATACNVTAMDHRWSRDGMSSCLFHTDVYRVLSYPLSARCFSISAKPYSSSSAKWSSIAFASFLKTFPIAPLLIWGSVTKSNKIQILNILTLHCQVIYVLMVRATSSIAIFKTCKLQYGYIPIHWSNGINNLYRLYRLFDNLWPVEFLTARLGAN